MFLPRTPLQTCSRSVSVRTSTSLRKKPPMLSKHRLLCEAIPGAIEGKSRAKKTSDVCVHFSAGVAQSIHSARAQYIVVHNSHAVEKNLHPENGDRRVQSLPPGTTVRKQGDETPLRRACTTTRDALPPFGMSPKDLDLSKCKSKFLSVILISSFDHDGSRVH